MEREKWNKIRTIMVTATAVIVVAAMIPLLFHSNLFSSGENPESELSDAVTCSSDTVEYPNLNHLNGELGHYLSIKMVFRSENITTLGVYYSIQYLNEENAKTALNELQADYNTQLARAGIAQNDTFEVRFTQDSDKLNFNLFINSNKALSKATSFIMADESALSSKSDYINNYEQAGLTCVKTIEE